MSGDWWRPAWLGGALLAALAGCTPMPEPEPPPAPDPLVGRIFAAPDARELDQASFIDRLLSAEVVYLGEKHDNLDHHRQQLAVVEELIARGARPAIGFETFDTGQTSRLLLYTQPTSMTDHGEDDERFDALAAARLQADVGWSSSDPRWSYYGPLLEIARAHRLPVFGLDLPIALRRRMARVGEPGLSGLERRLLSPSGFAHADYEALIRERLVRMHCGHGQGEFIDRLWEIWVARNDTMADAIVATLDEGAGEPVVIILGASHVHYDMGVYERVASLRPATRQVNVGMREVAPEPLEPSEYLQPLQYGDTQFPSAHQLLWFTARVEAHPGDPCERFRRASDKKEKAGKAPAG